MTKLCCVTAADTKVTQELPLDHYPSTLAAIIKSMTAILATDGGKQRQMMV